VLVRTRVNLVRRGPYCNSRPSALSGPRGKAQDLAVVGFRSREDGDPPEGFGARQQAGSGRPGDHPHELAERIDRREPGLSDDAFAILDSVSQGPASVWNLVHDPVRRVIRYRTWASPRVKRITVSSLDFSCTTGLKALDVDAERWGDVTDSFLPYTAEMNLSIVRRSFGKHFGPVQRGTVEYVTHFAEGFRCADAVK